MRLIDATSLIGNMMDAICDGYTEEDMLGIVNEQPTVDAVPKPKWIPIKTRPMSDEEREYYSEHFGYDIEYEEATMFDCKMPEDGQEVWVCYENGIVSQDVCENDDGMIGLEGNGDWDYIVAWMPFHKPEPYKTDGKGKNDGSIQTV